MNIVSNGSNVAFLCSSSGGPGNTFQWLKENILLFDEDSSMLLIEQVNSTAGGNYTCQVTNIAGTSSFTVTLYIEPYITLFPVTSLVVERTDPADFSCMADGFPFPNITWWKIAGYGVSPAMNVSVFNESDLTFPSVTHQDGGTYICVATAETFDGMELQSANTPGSVLTGKCRLPSYHIPVYLYNSSL